MTDDNDMEYLFHLLFGPFKDEGLKSSQVSLDVNPSLCVLGV